MINEEELIKELDFRAVKSSGPGGQHVNKTASKVELYFDIEKSQSLSEIQKERLLANFATRITKEKVFILQNGNSRSQHKNKDAVISQFLSMITSGTKAPKARKKTKPSKMAKLKRLRKKKIQSEKKQNRKNPLK
ncbi:alternative ribosome rescue aminoacyl-tRNA hydrolase ArfB [Zunongwangia sp. HRR-M8]|uniref:alternative ribosome rescue aminoacyl-tRNA hydrolase ArfB n=1 Tax=Zunongwangia sp. HRR-M8 TaxID=3015170 RepID=UPI0022DDB49A|nr:alternative ribosome rescue aminoacyl-tRNA hydrolase ArfB [Zunongwangia sp. HRR-M8]WBL22675.1 alternative ribosome rescue aminoacyl-tRNA hydrolase ArfB [Zunongwangia sp. HRR-M8]